MPVLYKQTDEYTLSHNPSEAIIKNSQSEVNESLLVSGSEIIHSFKCKSPMALETASEPWTLQAPLQKCTNAPCDAKNLLINSH